MRKILILFIRMLLGFLLCALSTVMSIKSNLGLSPWDVFNQGLSNLVGITMGQASIIVGLLIVILVSVLGLEIGFGTLANMIIVGVFIDLIIDLDIFKISTNLSFRVLLIIGSIFINAIGSYLYIGCQMGCGPRDGLMIVLVKITSKPVGLIRFLIESLALITGWLLGGVLGLGTLLTVFGMGYCVQVVYKFLNFDVKSLNQKNMKQCFIFIKECLTNKEDNNEI